jgi:hypothetical protein
VPGVNDASTTFAASVLHFTQWWSQQLLEIWESLFARGASVRVFLQRDGVRVDRTDADGCQSYLDPRPLEALDADSWQQLGQLIGGGRAEIVFTSPRTWSTSVRLPKAARRRLGSAVALQLLEVAPLSPDELIWTHREQHCDDETVTARITAIRSEHGLRLPPIAAVDGDDVVRVHRIQAPFSVAALSIARKHQIAAGLILAASPLLLWSTAEVLAASIRADNAALSAALAPKVATLANVRQSARVRGALASVARNPAITKLLETAASKLPADAHLSAAALRQDRKIVLMLVAAEPNDAAAALAQGDPPMPTKILSVAPDTSGQLRAEVVVAVP